MVSLTNKQIFFFFFFQAGSRAFQLPSASECISLTPWPRHSFKQSWVDHRLPVLRRCHSAAGLCQNADIPLSWERRDSGQNPCSRPSENFISDFFFFLTPPCVRVPCDYWLRSCVWFLGLLIGQLMGFPPDGSLSPSHLARTCFNGHTNTAWDAQGFKEIQDFVIFNTVNFFQEYECRELLNIIHH